MSAPARLLLLALSALGAGACAAEIGDECATSVDCSPEGDRMCDIAQVGGYCTIRDCTPDSCPDDALCVRFGSEQRFQRSFCMASCEGSSDCRDGYRCAEQDGEQMTVVDDDRSGRFCTQE